MTFFFYSNNNYPALSPAIEKIHAQAHTLWFSISNAVSHFCISATMLDGLTNNNNNNSRIKCANIFEGNK